MRVSCRGLEGRARRCWILWASEESGQGLGRRPPPPCNPQGLSSLGPASASFLVCWLCDLRVCVVLSVLCGQCAGYPSVYMPGACLYGVYMCIVCTEGVCLLYVSCMYMCVSLYVLCLCADIYLHYVWFVLYNMCMVCTVIFEVSDMHMCNACIYAICGVHTCVMCVQCLMYV